MQTEHDLEALARRVEEVRMIDTDKLRALDEAANRLPEQNPASFWVNEELKSYLYDNRTAILAMAEENARMREALEPFAKVAEFYVSCELHPHGCPDDASAGELVDLKVGDIRLASRALGKESS